MVLPRFHRVRVRYKSAPLALLDRYQLVLETLAYDYGQNGGVFHPHQKSSGIVSSLRDHFLVVWILRISLERQSGMLYELCHHPTVLKIELRSKFPPTAQKYLF